MHELDRFCGQYPFTLLSESSQCFVMHKTAHNRQDFMHSAEYKLPLKFNIKFYQPHKLIQTDATLDILVVDVEQITEHGSIKTNKINITCAQLRRYSQNMV